MITIAYASTSGATETVARQIGALLAGQEVLLINLKGEIPPVRPTEHLFAGTPSYGKGAWHFLWKRRSDEILPWFRNAGRVSLFGLGDERHHTATFAGGINQLAQFCEENAIPTIGRTRKADLSGLGRYFPGLVVDVGRDRRRADELLSDWLEACLAARKGAADLCLFPQAREDESPS